MRRATTLLCGLLLLVSGCGSDGDDPSRDAGLGQNPDAGQSPDAGAADTGTSNVACDPAFGQPDACGGDLQGTWSYQAACGTTPVAAALRQNCPSVTIAAERYNSGSGTLTVTGASFMLAVNVDVHVEAGIPAACVLGSCAATQSSLQTALPQVTIACSQSGAGCDCAFDGPVGTMSSGTVTTNDGVATVNDGTTYHYCVEGSSMTYRRFGTNTTEPVFVLRR